MKNLYICNTYYHLMIACIKSMKSNIACSVVLNANGNDCLLVDDKKLYSALCKSKIFESIYIINYSFVEKKIKPIKIFYPFFIKDEVGFNSYDNIYVFNDKTFIGRILNIRRIKYNLIEDGTDVFKNNYNKKIKQPKNLETFIKKNFLGYSFMGTSKNVLSIEVNDANGIPREIQNKKIIECNKMELIRSLNTSEKEKLLRVFLNEKLDEKIFNDSALLITQPLSEDGIVKNENTKIDLYKKIIDKYCSGYKLIIKTHPREKTIYSKYFENVKIINNNFPIELVNFFSIRIKLAITVSSTSLNLIDNAEEKIFLGWDWLSKEDSLKYGGDKNEN